MDILGYTAHSTQHYISYRLHLEKERMVSNFLRWGKNVYRWHIKSCHKYTFL